MNAIPHIDDLQQFMERTGRTPMITDRRKPWTYRGWNLPYAILVHEALGRASGRGEKLGGDRWGYYLRTADAGRLLDEPIPQIVFGPADREGEDILRRCVRLVGTGDWADFKTYVDWLAFGFALATEPPDLTDGVHEALYRTTNIGPWVEHPHDYLGDLAQEGKSGWNPNHFHATPHPVCELMTQMRFHDAREEDKDTRTLSVCDPCVGSGRMLLHASNFSMRLFGQDIDPLMVTITRINGVLYAPWIAFPLPFLNDDQPKGEPDAE